jgi:hypothetical protein
MSVYTAPKDRPRQQYIATSTFSGNFFSYATALNTTTLVTTGTLSAVTSTAGNCPAGRILRENGRRLFSNADPGVSTFMVGVVDSVTGLSGFIDPNASLFQNYTGARAADLADGLDYSVSAAGSNHRGPSVFTLGNVIASRQIYSATTTALTPGATITIDGNLGQVFTLAQGSGVAVVLSATVPPSGSVVYLIVTQAGTAAAITQGTNVKMASVTPTSAKTTTISFVSDGTNLNQFASAISA